MGSAFKNKGVQKLLDAVIRYLPSPLERPVKARVWDNPEEAFPLDPDPNKPFVGMAFKIVDDPYGQLTLYADLPRDRQEGRDLLQSTHQPKDPL